MTEKEAMDWIQNMQFCLREDQSLSPNVKSHLNEIHRFLVEFCCPQMTARARSRLAAALSQLSTPVLLGQDLIDVRAATHQHVTFDQSGGQSNPRSD